MTTASTLPETARKFLAHKRLSQAQEDELDRPFAVEELPAWRARLFPAVTSKARTGYLPCRAFASRAFRGRWPEARITWHVPEDYSPENPTGLLLFLHGGDRSTAADAPWRVYFNPRGTMRELAENCRCILAAPSAPAGPDGKRWNHPGASEYILAVIREAAARYAVDGNRVILAGHSMGGFGAYHQGQILADRFAGVLLSAGGWWEADFKNFTGTGVFLLHGRNDCAAAFKGALAEPRHHDWCGFSFARAADELMTRDGVAHVWRPHDGGHSPACEEARNALRDFAAWQMLQRRNPDPPQVYIGTPAGSSDPLMQDRLSAHWLDIVELATGDVEHDRIRLEGPNVAWTDGELARQTYRLERFARSGARLEGNYLGHNRFRLSGCNAAVARIWLKPSMVDFSRPVEVEWEGAVRTFAVEPTLRTLLASALRRHDPDLLAPAAIELQRDTFAK